MDGAWAGFVVVADKDYMVADMSGGFAFAFDYLPTYFLCYTFVVGVIDDWLDIYISSFISKSMASSSTSFIESLIWGWSSM